jgi:polysaccharide pyruvyl transferase WcaK-like protein
MGYGNLGDAATQDALIANIKRRLKDTEIIGFSLNPDDTRKRHHIPSYSITFWHPGLNKAESADTDGSSSGIQLKSMLKKIPVFSPIALRTLYLARELAHLRRIFKVLRSLDSLIIAGGGQLSELWRGPWSHPYNVLKFSVLTRLAGRKLLFLNVGAGPLDMNLSKIFVKASLHLADYVSFRDVESQDLVQRLGVRCKTYVFPDSAYALEVEGYKVAAARKVSRRVVGINPIGFCDPRIWPRKDVRVYSEYLDKMAEFSRWLLSLNCVIRIFSSDASVDVYAMEELRERLRTSLSPAGFDELGARPNESVKNLLADISEFDFVVTSKFHGVVFSHLLEKPVIALSYHRKIDDLMQRVGHSQYCLDIENFELEHLKSTFTALLTDAEMLKSKFRQATASFSAALSFQFDGLFVTDRLALHTQEMRAARNGAVLRDSG